MERMLLESDAARREFWERASLHGCTHAAAKLNYGAKPAAERAQGRGGNCAAIRFEAFVSWLRAARVRLGWKVIWAGSACAAAVMLWLGIRWLQPAGADEEYAVADTAMEPTVNTNFIAMLDARKRGRVGRRDQRGGSGVGGFIAVAAP